MSNAAQEAVEWAASSGAALTGAVVLVGGLSLTPLAVVAARAIAPRRAVHFARWRFLHLGLVLVLTMAAATLAGGLLAGSGLDLHEVLLGQLATAVGLGAAALAIVRLARQLDPAGARSLGLWRGGHGRAIAAGLAAYAICGPALTGAMLVWPWLVERLGGEWSQQTVVTRLLELSPAGVVALVLLAALVQPLLEELLFRGFVQPLLVQNLGDRGGVALTSVLFASLHGVSAFLPVFALSLLLGAMMLRTQRLSAVYVVHALHNTMMLALVFLSAHTEGMLAPGESASGLIQLVRGLP